MTKIRIGLVGIGKIAREQHIPVVIADPDFELTACVSRSAKVDGIDNFTTLETMLDARPDIDAVVVASPPATHFAAARLALEAGKHVFLEKPPCATMAELDWLEDAARRKRRTLFQTWHLRYAPRVADAEEWLKGRKVVGGHIVWKEDVRRFHPGQDWIWRSGGFGVFDPGINAVSILTRILPEAVLVEAAELFFPSNCQTPVAADIAFRTESGAGITAALDFFCQGEQSWDIELTAADGKMRLADSARVFAVDGERRNLPDSPDGVYAEYAPLYRRFSELIARGESEVDAAPFRLVADIFLIGKHISAPPLNLV
jgi:predicted dehydrogenase